MVSCSRSTAWWLVLRERPQTRLRKKLVVPQRGPQPSMKMEHACKVQVGIYSRMLAGGRAPFPRLLVAIRLRTLRLLLTDLRLVTALWKNTSLALHAEIMPWAAGVKDFFHPPFRCKYTGAHCVLSPAPERADCKLLLGFSETLSYYSLHTLLWNFDFQGISLKP